MKISQEKVCPFCQQKSNSIVMQTKDYRFNIEGLYKFAFCQSCQLVYLLNPLSLAKLEKLYNETSLPQARVDMGLSALREFWWHLNREPFADLKKEKISRVLDIGFGQAPTLIYLKNKGFDVYGVELNANLVTRARKLGIKAFIGPLEAVQFPDNYFDMIILSQVLEHIPEPLSLLREVYRILANQGKVIVYVPNRFGYLASLFGKYWHGWYAPFHFFVFSEDNLRQLASLAQFKVQEVKTFTPTNFLRFH